VPVLGNLFSAEEKGGGGLFAWTYKVKGALAPVILRKIFQLDGGDKTKQDQQ